MLQNQKLNFSYMYVNFFLDFSTPILTRYPEGKILMDQTCVMICQTDGDDSTLSYSWFHDNVKITGDNSYYVSLLFIF